MPFELGAKKAGLSLVRAFLHSVEGVRPYPPLHPAPSSNPSRNAPSSTTSSSPTAMARLSTSNVLSLPPSHRVSRRRFPLPWGQKVISHQSNPFHSNICLDSSAQFPASTPKRGDYLQNPPYLCSSIRTLSYLSTASTEGNICKAFPLPARPITIACSCS